MQTAQQYDAQDELAAFRARFYAPTDAIYLDGNSLGLLSRDAEAAVLRVLSEWKTQAIGGWTDGSPGWIDLAEAVAAQIAPLLGADAAEIAVAGSTTVNIHQMLATLYDPTAPRKTILADALTFPSDLYALQSHLRLRGLEPEKTLRLVGSADALTLDENALTAAMTDDVQMALLPSVLYRSGQLLDMERLTASAHERGICIGFDCAHSIGTVPHALSRWGADFAVWCHYKYCNSGPGAIAGMYLNRRHFGRAPGLAGWFGNRKQTMFAMSPDFDAADDASALQIGTPPMLSLAAVQGALRVHAEAGIERIRAKSLLLTEFLMHLADTELAPLGFALATPREPSHRGGHIALLHPEAAPIARALRRVGVVPDYRPPGMIRLAPAALYNSFADCEEAVIRLKRVMEQELYREPEESVALVS